MTDSERIDCKTVIYYYKEENTIIRFDSAYYLLLDQKDRICNLSSQKMRNVRHR
ncbi:MAG: hypothetical protein R2685_16300 [Candidatus Nitrosocosmicus sp.]|nr:hypothetical protein [Candidatus Nitrosocosmicus sp.]